MRLQARWTISGAVRVFVGLSVRTGATTGSRLLQACDGTDDFPPFPCSFMLPWPMLEQTSAYAPRMLFYICDHTPTTSPKTSFSNRGSPVNPRMGAGMDDGTRASPLSLLAFPAYTSNLNYAPLHSRRSSCREAFEVAMDTTSRMPDTHRPYSNNAASLPLLRCHTFPPMPQYISLSFSKDTRLLDT